MNGTEDRQASCADRLDGHLRSREDSLRELFTKIEGTDDGTTDDQSIEDAQEELDNFALGVSTKVLLRIDISTGGPADYLTAICERGRYGLDVESVSYHFADWFDHAERPVDEGSPLYRYAEQCAEYVQDAGTGTS